MLCLVFLSSACAQAMPPPVRDPLTPVIIVPGWELGCEPKGPADWAAWTTRAADYHSLSVTLMQPNPCEDNRITAAHLSDLIDQTLAETGANKVTLVAHSMGALAARWCIRFGGCAHRVEALITVAAANHGTIWANLCELAFWQQSACQMNPGSEFLQLLNSEDETWGDTTYVNFQSACDLTIVPFVSSWLDGAYNNLVDRCIGHSGWKTDQATIAWTYGWVQGDVDQPPTTMT